MSFLPVTNVIACLITILHLEQTAGAAVASTNGLVRQQHEGCTLFLPSNRLFAPVVTDVKTQEELVPIQDKRIAGDSWFLPIEPNRKIKVNCGRGNTLSIHDTYHYLQLTCVRGTEFRDNDDELVVFSDGISCDNPRKPTPILYRNGTCSIKGTKIDVDFVTDNPPRKYYTVCIDEEISGTLYSSSILDGESMANGLVEGGGNRPDFRGTEFYPFSIKQAYKWENVFEHLSNLLGSEDLVNQYFPTQQYRFSRGHLFPNADAVKRFEKHATFYYVNTVPQWQVLNGGNWNLVEQDVRDLATKLAKILKVVTGSFGITTLPDENNNDVQLFMARDSTGKLRLPVPRFVWKVIHDPAASEAVAIVQVNNPWVLQRDIDILCNDVCAQLRWLRSSDYDSSRKGYTYCCDVNELRRVIPYVPQLEYKNLLGVTYDNSEATDGDDDIEEESEDDEDSESDSYDDEESSSSEEYDVESRRRNAPLSTHGSKMANHNIADLFSQVRLGESPKYFSERM